MRPFTNTSKNALYALLVVFGSGVTLVLSGMAVVQSAASVGVVAIQAFGGALWWRLAQRTRPVSGLECMGMGLAIGTSTAMLCGAALWATPVRSIAWLLPTIAAIGMYAVHRRRRLPSGEQSMIAPVTRPTGLAFAIGVIGGLVALSVNWLRSPLSWAAGAPTLHPDMLFFEALQRSVVSFGPGDSLFAVGTGIRYHWFTFFWAGDVARIAGLDGFASITRVLPLTVLVGTAALASAWAGRLTRSSWVPCLAVLLVVIAGYLGAGFGAILNFDSPSQSLTALWMLAASLLVLDFLSAYIAPSSMFLLAAVAASLMGGKVSQAAILIASTAGAAVFLVWRDRGAWFRPILALTVVTCSCAISYVLVIAGINPEGNLAVGGLANRASGVQGLDPGTGSWAVVIGTATLVIAVLARNAGVVWLVADSGFRGRVDTWFVVSGLAAGIGALVVVSQGVNDLWFILSASGTGAIYSAVGVGIAVDRSRPRPARSSRGIALMAVFGGLIALLVIVLPTVLGSQGARSLAIWAGVLGALLAGVIVARVAPAPRSWVAALAWGTGVIVIASVFARASSIDVIQSKPREDPVQKSPTMGDSDDPLVRAPGLSTREEAAARWVRVNTNEESIGATNRIDTPLVPALTGRRQYVSAINNLDGLGSPADLPEIFRRADVSASLVDPPTASAARELCNAGVSWIWLEGLDATSAGNPASGQDVYVEAWREGDVLVLILKPGACPESGN